MKKSTSNSQDSAKKKKDGGKGKSRRRKSTPQLIKDTDAVWHCKYCMNKFEDDEDKVLECERCFRKVCLPCTDGEVDDCKYEVFSDKQCPFIWFCNECKSPAMQAISTDFKIEEKCKIYCENLRQEFAANFAQLNNDIQTLKDKVCELSKTQTQPVITISTSKGDSENDSNPSNNSPSETVSVESVIKSSTNEFEEREKRKCNVMFFGIPESSKTEINDRVKDDLKYIGDLGKKVFDLDSSVFTKARRLGKKQPKKHRPLQIVVDSPARVMEILKNAKKLGDKENSEYKSISIQRDMTPLEQEENKKLLKQRNDLRDKAKNEGTSEIWVIRNRKVIDVAKK